MKIRKCNGRLNLGKNQIEPTFQVVLDALALTPCYSVFLTTADVPEVYMHQLWDFIHKHDTSYRFKMAERRNSTSIWKLTKISFRSALEYMVKTLMNFPDEVIVSFFKELGHTMEIKSITDVVVDQMQKP
ncbi:hypothetical protein Tco_0299060 [Tanacetum coccineum]